MALKDPLSMKCFGLHLLGLQPDASREVVLLCVVLHSRTVMPGCWFWAPGIWLEGMGNSKGRCPCFARCEECQVLWCSTGSSVELLMAKEVGFPGSSANLLRFPNPSVLCEWFYLCASVCGIAIDVFIHYLFLIPQKVAAGNGKHWGTVTSLWYISQNLLFCEAAG